MQTAHVSFERTIERLHVKTTLRLFAAALSVILLAACAGSGNGDGAGGPSAPAADVSGPEGWNASEDPAAQLSVRAAVRSMTALHLCGGADEAVALTLAGTEICPAVPAPEELSAPASVPVAGDGYRTEYLEKTDPALGFSVFDRSILTCYADGVPRWSAEFTDFCVEGSAALSGGTAVWGQNYGWSSEQSRYGWLARVDGEGKILWERRFDHGFRWESVTAVLDVGDGTWAVVSRGDFRYLCLSRYDTDGNELLFSKTEVGNLGVRDAIRMGDGCLVRLDHAQEQVTAMLYRLGFDGTVLDRLVYDGGDSDYYLTGMAQSGGLLFLSAYVVPKQTDEGGRYEIGNILKEALSRESFNYPEEELTSAVRENYTAVLLLCGAESGLPTAFYAVPGALGGKLSVNDAGETEWEVQSVVTTFFSPMTSSFTVGGTCEVFRCTLDAAGGLLRWEDTGETAPYRR